MPRRRLLVCTRTVAVCLGLLMLQACHTLRFEIEGSNHDKVVEETNWFYLFGWFPTREIDVAGKCPKGAAAIKEQTTFGDGFIDFISLGVVSPRSIWYYCLPETRKAAALPAQEAAK